MFKTIVAGFDGSDASGRALEAACGLATLCGAELHLVHSPEVFTSQLSTAPAPEDHGQEVMQAAVAQAKAAGVTPASATVGDDTAYTDIMTIVDLYAADLVITGRRGLGGVSGLLLGSTSQKLAQHAKCACMTVS